MQQGAIEPAPTQLPTNKLFIFLLWNLDCFHIFISNSLGAAFLSGDVLITCLQVKFLKSEKDLFNYCTYGKRLYFYALHYSQVHSLNMMKQDFI